MLINTVHCCTLSAGYAQIWSCFFLHDEGHQFLIFFRRAVFCRYVPRLVLPLHA